MLMSLGSRVFGFLQTILPSQLRLAASPRLLGRYTGGAGAAQEIQLGAGFSFVGDTLTYTSPGGGATWGAITGTLSSQADLATALAGKAASSHTHVSANISDLTFGGNSSADANKGAKFGTAGELFCSYFFRIYDPDAGPPTYIQLEHLESPSPNQSAKLPNKTGAVCILPIYADSTAANAAVSVGDAWWDLTLNKARVRLS